MTVRDSHIFVHFPKTAGVSIRKLFEATFGPQNVSQPFVVTKIDDQEHDRLQQPLPQGVALRLAPHRCALGWYVAAPIGAAEQPQANHLANTTYSIPADLSSAVQLGFVPADPLDHSV